MGSTVPPPPDISDCAYFSCWRSFCSIFWRRHPRTRRNVVAPLDIPRAVVIDNGSLTLKAGFAGDDEPRVVFPAVIGRPKQFLTRVLDSAEQQEFYVGDDAQRKRGILALKYPVQDGIVTSWDDMEKIWEHTFSELNVDCKNQPVLLSEASNNPIKNKEKTVEIMFETYGVPALYMEVQAVLSLHASGLVTGVAVNMGEGSFEAAPVYEGSVISYAVQKAGLSGKGLTELLIRMLGDRGHSYTSSAEREIVRDMKEKLCYVSPNFKQETQNAKTSSKIEKSYTLPDDEAVTLGDERFRCTEAIFDPAVMDQNGRGVPKTTLDSVLKCDREMHSDLFSNIVVSGGNSLYQGFSERFKNELSAFVPSGTNFNMITDGGLYRAWLGGSKMAASSSFTSKCIVEQEYTEYGSLFVTPKLIH